MARSPNEKHECPLFSRRVYWSECYEVQDIRDDDMDMSLAFESFDIDQANEICEKCRWYVVGEDE